MKEGQLNNASLSCNYNYTINGFMPFFLSARRRDGPLDDRLTLFYSLRALPCNGFERTVCLKRNSSLYQSVVVRPCLASGVRQVACITKLISFQLLLDAVVFVLWQAFHVECVE